MGEKGAVESGTDSDGEHVGQWDRKKGIER